MRPLKTSAAFHEQRRSLERAQTEECLKKKMRNPPERSELHFLEEASAQAGKRQLRRVHLADDVNDKIAKRLVPMELICKNILPIPRSIKQAIEDLPLRKTSEDSWSCDEDSNCSLSPEQHLERPVGSQHPLSSPESPAANSAPSPTQLPSPAPPLLQTPGSSPTLQLANGKAAQIKAGGQLQLKANCDRFARRHRKATGDRPKIKKLKYHQYIPPDQKADTEAPSHLDSSYAKVLQQQQLFLQLQILNQQQQQQKHSYQAILPAPIQPPMDQQPPSSSPSGDEATRLPSPQPAAVPPGAGLGSVESPAHLGGAILVSPPPNLDWMKVAELKLELKRRSLPVSGTKSDLIERLRNYQELLGAGGGDGGDSTASPTAGVSAGPAAGGRRLKARQQQQPQKELYCIPRSLIGRRAKAVGGSTPAPALVRLPFCAGAPDHLPSGSSSEESSVGSDITDETVTSPIPKLSPATCSPAKLGVTPKEEPRFSPPTPCESPTENFPLCDYHWVPPSSGASFPAATAPVKTKDKDKMLKEKDRQIEELIILVKQQQRLVEALKMQLKQGKSKSKGPEPLVVAKVKLGRAPSPPCRTDIASVERKGDVASTATQRLHPCLSPSVKSELKTHKNQHRVCLQKSNQEFVQQQAIQKLLQKQQQQQKKQQQSGSGIPQTLERCQAQKRKCSEEKQQPVPLKNQPLPLQQQRSQRSQTLQGAAAPRLRKPEEPPPGAHKAKRHGPRAPPKQSSQPGILRGNSAPAADAEGRGHCFLIDLTSHIKEKAPQRGKCGDEVSRSFSAPGGLQSVLGDAETPPPGKHTSSPNTPDEPSSGVDVLSSPLPPASVRPAASSPAGEAKEHEHSFLDTILQTKEKPASFKPRPSLYRQYFSSAVFPPPPPRHLTLPPPCDSPSVHSELQTRADPAEEDRHLWSVSLLEECLSPELGELATLIDDLHGHNLCTSSILEPPPSPLSTALKEINMDGMDWFHLTSGDEEPLSPDLLGPPTPSSVFSTDFLDSPDLPFHWDL